LNILKGKRLRDTLNKVLLIKHGGIKMGHIAEKYFDVEECPKCKGKKFKAVVTFSEVYYKDDGSYWEDEMAYGEEDVKVFCCNCGNEI